MEIAQVFNNNVVLVYHDNKEMVLFGTGIGFRKKAGDTIDQSIIQKKFILEGNKYFQEIAAIFEVLDQEEVDTVFEIVNDAKKKIDMKISNSIYPALADHLHYAIIRARQGVYLKCPLHNEIKYLYPNYHRVCQKYVNDLNRKFKVDLNDDEASTIVLHMLNAGQNHSSFEKTVAETKIVKDIVDIVRMNFGIEFHEDNFFYHRFIVHLQFFAKRVIKNEMIKSSDTTLLNIVKSNYFEAYQCVESIGRYLMNTYSYKMNDDDITYLTLHLVKITE